ncbi:MAG TPA: hypothetical protein VFA21_14605 [Pyrinomonadaceae bacterium]|nr:hypothetical protein [Pyrinomonadaceae bacterium]
MNIWKSKYRVDGAQGSSRRALRGNVSARRGAGAERATIICAVVIAAALGGASGLWLSAQWASAAASADSPAPASPSGVRAAASEPPARPGEAGNTPTAASDANAAGDANALDKAPASNGDAGPISHDNIEPTSRDNVEPPAGARIPSRGRPEDGGDAAKADAVGTIVATGRERSAEKADKGSGARTAETRLAFGRAQGGPCRLSASAGALAIRGGGSAAVTLSLGGAGGRITASTPDWSNIVVLSESGPFGNEAQRFAIRSVSGRPGTYSVSFASPCGSRTVTVTVTGIQR